MATTQRVLEVVQEEQPLTSFGTSEAPIPFGIHIDSVGGFANGRGDTITPEHLVQLKEEDFEALVSSPILNPSSKAIVKEARRQIAEKAKAEEKAIAAKAKALEEKTKAKQEAEEKTTSPTTARVTVKK